MKKRSCISRSRVLTVCCVLFVIASILVSIICATYILSDSTSYNTRAGFYDVPDCDVLFIGTSHMYDAVYPMEMYRDYGISSYNLSCAGERLAMSYYSLKDALEAHEEIKLVVVDMHALRYGNEKNDPEVPVRCHYTFDAMKWSRIKTDAITDCVDREFWPEFFFPLYFYHERWTQLDKRTLAKRGSRCELSRGANYEMGVVPPIKLELIDIRDHEYFEDYSTEYLQKMIDLCNDKGIKVLIIYIPFPAWPDPQRMANRACEIAERNDNAEYINYLYDIQKIGIDFDTDVPDNHSHLNPLGARKFTRYIGRYIKDAYDLPDHSGEAEWEESYGDYVSKVKDTYFAGTTDLYSYMTLCADEDYSCEFCFGDDIPYNEDTVYQKLMKSIKKYGSYTDSGKSIPNDVSYIRIADNTDSSPVLSIEVRRADGELVDTSLWDAEKFRLKRNEQ